MSTISLQEALREYIQENHESPVITDYDINLYLFELYKKKEFKGTKIGKITLAFPDYKVVYNSINSLLKQSVMKEISGISAYELVGFPDPTTQQIVCSVNPFCYVSHISAMEWHGLTDRIPKLIHITTCSSRKFRSFVSEKMFSDFGNYRSEVKAKLRNKFEVKAINGKEIIEHETDKFINKKAISGTGGVKVSTIGETFLTMIREPDCCGGISHVIDVFENFGEKFKILIIKEVDKNGTKIDKCRAGYILDEHLGCKHKTIDEWAISSVGRGGSRKLVASEPYSDRFSEKWCISINN